VARSTVGQLIMKLLPAVSEHFHYQRIEIGTPEPISRFKFHFELFASPPRSDLGHRAFKMSEFQDRRFHYELSDCIAPFRLGVPCEHCITH